MNYFCSDITKTQNEFLSLPNVIKFRNDQCLSGSGLKSMLIKETKKYMWQIILKEELNNGFGNY